MNTTHDGRAGQLRAAERALREARCDAALSLLTDCEDWPGALAEAAVLLKADALLRRDNAAGLAWLAATQDVVETAAGRFRRELLTARGYANVRNFDAADARLGRASALLSIVPEGACDLAYQTARMRWFRRSATPDDPDLLLACSNPNPSGRIAAYAVRAWTFAMRDDYAGQIADFCMALDVARNANYEVDIATLGIIVHSLARVAFETADAQGLQVAREACEAIAWTDDVRVDQFQTLRALGWDAFMRGESARAQWLFRDASLAAPSPPWQALAHLDRAYVARISGNEPWCLDELTQAVRIGDDVAWGQTFGEERLALVALANLLAPINAGEAQRYAAMYSMLGRESVSPTLALAQDPRGVGFEKYAFGRIEQTLGNDDTALAALRESYDIFAPRRHHYQAMLAAEALFELTGDDEWRERRHVHLGRYPGSPLLVAATAPEPIDVPHDNLTSLQRQIARALISGMGVDELSRRFSRSRYTIERSIEAIYATYNVRSAHALRDTMTAQHATHATT